MPEIDKKINIGQILLLLGMAGSVAVLYATVVANNAVQENRLNTIDASIAKNLEHSVEIAKAVEIMGRDLAVIQYKLGVEKPKK